MIATDFISDSITYVKNDYSGEQVLTLMNVFQVKHLPVIDNNRALLGLISDDDVLVRSYDQPISSYKLEYKQVQVAPEQHVYDIIHLLSKRDISLIPVVEDKKYIGSIRKQDVISFLGKSFSFTYPGSIIELIIQNRNYSLAEISRIVEAENAKILSVFIAEAGEDNNRLKVILKINKPDISTIIAAFERFEYEINASYTDHSEYDDLLRERYDALMRYLNV
jgi:CBS domain-containing protein